MLALYRKNFVEVDAHGAEEMVSMAFPTAKVVVGGNPPQKISLRHPSGEDEVIFALDQFGPGYRICVATLSGAQKQLDLHKEEEVRVFWPDGLTHLIDSWGAFARFQEKKMVTGNKMPGLLLRRTDRVSSAIAEAVTLCDE